MHVFFHFELLLFDKFAYFWIIYDGGSTMHLYTSSLPYHKGLQVVVYLFFLQKKLSSTLCPFSLFLTKLLCHEGWAEEKWSGSLIFSYSSLGWRLGLQAITGTVFLTFFLGTCYRSASLYHPQRRAILHLKNQKRKVWTQPKNVIF